MFPPGFLGTRADVLIDIVTLSFVIILPMLVWSWRLARVEKNYRVHRNVQLSLAVTLAIVVSLFKFANPPCPNRFSGRHRLWGRIGMFAMIGAAVAAPPLYYFGFVA